ncbi:MAG: hypothetical protein ACTJLM_01720 [Ehrlichia sp.]
MDGLFNDTGPVEAPGVSGVVATEAATTLVSTTGASNTTDLVTEAATTLVSTTGASNTTDLVTEAATTLVSTTGASNTTDLVTEAATTLVSTTGASNTTDLVTEAATTLVSTTGASNTTDLVTEAATTLFDSTASNMTDLVTEAATTLFDSTDASNMTDLVTDAATTLFDATGASNIANSTGIVTCHGAECVDKTTLDNFFNGVWNSSDSGDSTVSADCSELLSNGYYVVVAILALLFMLALVVFSVYCAQNCKARPDSRGTANASDNRPVSPLNLVLLSDPVFEPRVPEVPEPQRGEKQCHVELQEVGSATFVSSSSISHVRGELSSRI